MFDGKLTADRLSLDKSSSDAPRVSVSKPDLEAAWAILENLAVSLDQIGGMFDDSAHPADGEHRQPMADALINYLSQDVVASIGDARSRLSRYISDDDAERVADSIGYWNYARAKS